MKELKYPIGTIVGLEGTRHVGIVYDQYHTVELIASPDHETDKLRCKIVTINLQEREIHPVSNKPFTYIFKDFGEEFSPAKLKAEIMKVRYKYDNTIYNKLTNNCQHFAYEIATGVRKSPDGDPLKWLGAFEKTISKIEKLTNGDSTSSMNSIGLESFQNELDQLMLAV
jgi:hypothetical protein